MLTKKVTAYIWLNPVVTSSYDREEMKKLMEYLNLELVGPKENHLKVVLEKYKKALEVADKPILDKRCPLIVDHYKDKMDEFYDVDIEPILIHVARELSARSDLKDKPKYIITPCESLKNMGNSLNFDKTFFYTWDEFVRKNHIGLEGKKLDDSPIPFGFFKPISDKTIFVSKDSLSIDNNILKKTEIVEGLYCHRGCHNGDGVRCIKSKKQ